MRLSTLVLAITAALSGFGAFAGAAHAVPTSIPYTGVLQVGGNNGNSPVDIQVRMFDALAAGNQIWPAGNALAAFPATPLRAGRFSINLGSANQPLDASVLGVEGRNLYLQITVNGTTLSPRQQLLAVPYAVDAGSAAIRAEIALVRSELTASREFHVGVRPPFQAGSGVPQTGRDWTPVPVDSNPTVTFTPRADGVFRLATALYLLGDCTYVRIRLRGADAVQLASSMGFVCGTGGSAPTEAYFRLRGGTEYTADVEYLTPDQGGAIGQDGDTRMVGYRVE